MPDRTEPPVDLGPLEADFAALHADLARIADTKFSLGNAALDALDTILGEARAPAPDAEAAVGFRFQEALLRMMKESAATDLHGNTGFSIDQASLLAHGAPVIQEVVAVAQDKVQSILDELTTSVTGATSPGAASPDADAAEPSSKGVKLKLDFASLFGGLLKTAAEAAKGPPKKG